MRPPRGASGAHVPSFNDSTPAGVGERLLSSILGQFWERLKGLPAECAKEWDANGVTNLPLCCKWFVYPQDLMLPRKSFYTSRMFVASMSTRFSCPFPPNLFFLDTNWLALSTPWKKDTVVIGDHHPMSMVEDQTHRRNILKPPQKKTSSKKCFSKILRYPRYPQNPLPKKTTLSLSTKAITGGFQHPCGTLVLQNLVFVWVTKPVACTVTSSPGCTVAAP